MNKQRRSEIADIIWEMEGGTSATGMVYPGLIGQIEALKERIDTLRDEEEAYIANMPENMYGGEKQALAEQAYQALSEAYDAFEEFGAEGIVESLREAMA